MNRASSPMSTLSANTINARSSGLKTKGHALSTPAPAAGQERCDSPLLPDVTLSASVRALINENAQMLCTIPTLQNEVDKTQTLLHRSEAARSELQQEVNELRGQLNLATENVTTGSGAVSNLRQRCKEQEEMVKVLREENDRLKRLMGTHEDQLRPQDRPTTTARNSTAATTEQILSQFLTPVMLNSVPRTANQMQAMYEDLKNRPADAALAKRHLETLRTRLEREVATLAGRLNESDTSSLDDETKAKVADFKRAVATTLTTNCKLLEASLSKVRA